MQSRRRLVKKLIKHMERVQSQLRSGQVSAWSGLDLTMPQVKTLFPPGGRANAYEAHRRTARRGDAVRHHHDRSTRCKRVGRAQARPGGPAGRGLFRHPRAGRDAVEKFWSLRAARIETLAAALSDEDLEIVVPAMKIMAHAVRRPGLGVEGGQGGTHHREGQPVESVA